jgi:hypothetical protein
MPGTGGAARTRTGAGYTAGLGGGSGGSGGAGGGNDFYKFGGAIANTVGSGGGGGYGAAGGQSKYGISKDTMTS